MLPHVAASSSTFRPGLLSLCSGTGMLDLAVKLAFEHVTGRWPRVLGFAEREAFAAALLLARMEEQSLEPSPVFCGDFRDLDARPLRGHCDLFAAGLPCQPYSAAGKRRGLRDERSYGKGDGPLPHALRIISECAPALVCLENVPQWVTSGAFRRFGDSLAALGYEIEDPLFVRASDVGASHRRERVFILAHLPGQRKRFLVSTGLRPEGRGAPHPERRGPAMADDQSERRGARGAESSLHGGRPAASKSGGPVADTHGQRRQQERGSPSGDEGPNAGRCPSHHHEPECAGEAVADAECTGRFPAALGGIHCEQESLGARNEHPAGFRSPLFAPGPDDFEAWAHALRNAPHLAPALEPGVCVLADGMAFPLDASRPDQLRCAGNGVVALQAAAAFAHLFRRLSLS